MTENSGYFFRNIWLFWIYCKLRRTASFSINFQSDSANLWSSLSSIPQRYLWLVVWFAQLLYASYGRVLESLASEVPSCSCMAIISSSAFGWIQLIVLQHFPAGHHEISGYRRNDSLNKLGCWGICNIALFAQFLENHCSVTLSDSLKWLWEVPGGFSKIDKRILPLSAWERMICWAFFKNCHSLGQWSTNSNPFLLTEESSPPRRNRAGKVRPPIASHTPHIEGIWGKPLTPINLAASIASFPPPT